jgi:hypothetical protein
MRALIVRKPRSRRISDRIAYGKLVAESMKDNPYFPKPIPALARLVAHIAAADAAHVAALTREAGTAATLAAAIRAVEGDLESLHVHVQRVASMDATNGPAIVASAGMSLKDAHGPSPADFTVKQGRISGSVVLVVRAVARKASYDWQYSTDELTWTSAEMTFRAKTTLVGLATGTRYFFRFRARTPEVSGTGAASSRSSSCEPGSTAGRPRFGGHTSRILPTSSKKETSTCRSSLATGRRSRGT